MNKLCIANARVLTMEGYIIERGFVSIEQNKITAVGKLEDMPKEQSNIMDAAGGWLLPGLIDIHSHLGLFGDGLGFESEDGNEDTDPITPHLRVLDGINPLDRCFAEARAAGITTVVIGPGSANPIGGQMAAIRTNGRRIDDMILRAPCAIKFALGENPKTCYREKDDMPATRMATAALIREQLEKAEEYARRKKEALSDEDKPDFDAKLEALIPLLDREIEAHFHAHRADDIFTALRIAREFHLKPVIVHGTEAHLVADLIAQEEVPVISGPFMSDRSKPELRNLTERAPGLLSNAGVLVAITTDHPEYPVKFLMDAARLAVRGGMAVEDALRAITIHAAQIVGLAHRIGSIASGKDADLVLYTGDPFAYQSKVAMVLCEGKRMSGEEIF